MAPKFPRPGRALAVVVGAGVLLSATGGEIAAAVTAGSTQSAAIRAGAGVDKAAVGGLVRGQRISTIGAPKAGWVKVRFDGGTAYVVAKKLNITGKGLPAGPLSIKTAGTKVTTTSVNVRQQPTVRSAAVGTLPEGSRITLTGSTSGGFAQTSFRGKLRWVSMMYLASTPAGSAPAAEATPAPTPAPAPTPEPAATPTPAPTPTSEASAKGEAALTFARKQLGKSYAFGAAGPDAYDCSGLTLASWKAAGVTLPRTSQQQFKFGTKIAKSELQPGDLVFFYGPDPTHVGIYAGDGEVVHSPRPGKTVEYIKIAYMPYAGAIRPA